MQYVYLFLIIALLIYVLGKALLYIIGAIIAIIIAISIIVYLYENIMRFAKKRKSSLVISHSSLEPGLLDKINRFYTEFNRITTTFGKGIFHEERVTNIYSDLFNDEHHPQRDKLLKEAMSIGVVEDVIMSINKGNIVATIDDSTRKLVNLGYEKREAEGLLYGLAKCYGLLITDDGEVVQVQSALHHIHIKLNSKKWIFYLLPFIGLLSIFWVTYLYEARQISLFLVYLYIFIIYLISFVYSWYHFYSQGESAFNGGFFSGINLAGIIFILASEWMCEVFMRFFGLATSLDQSTLIFPMYVIILNILGFIGGFIISGTETEKQHNYTTILNPILFIAIITGFVLSFIVAFASYHLVSWSTEIKDAISSSIIYSNRKDEVKSLECSGIQLGGDAEFNLLKLRASNRYYYKDNYSLSEALKNGSFLEDKDLFPFDSIMSVEDCSPDWDRLYLCVCENKIIAIICKLKSSTFNEIMSLYIKKYGEPEHKHSHISIDYEDKNPYRWRFKNCQILIKGGGLVYNANPLIFDETEYSGLPQRAPINDDNKDVFICYIDNSFKSILSKREKRQKQIQDSIFRQQEVKRKRDEAIRKEQRKQEVRDSIQREKLRMERTLRQI